MGFDPSTLTWTFTLYELLIILGSNHLLNQVCNSNSSFQLIHIIKLSESCLMSVVLKLSYDLISITILENLEHF